MTARDRRAALAAPYQREHAASISSIAREPRTLTEGIKALKQAVAAETIDRSHVAGVEAEQGVTTRAVAQAIAEGRPIPRVLHGEGGSHLGTPRWSHDFRLYITGSPFASDVAEDGTPYWLRPLQSSIVRMENSSSGIDRLSARTVHALPFHRYNVRETWWALCGPLANGDAEHMAEAWAQDALRRWWGYYVETPRGRLLTS